MSDMVNVLIKLPKDIYEEIINSKQRAEVYARVEYSSLTIGIAIINGTVLPKGHGKLIDADTYRKEMLDSREFDFFKRLDMQPTIIEADKEE